MLGERAHVKLTIIIDRWKIPLRDVFPHQRGDSVIACHKPKAVGEKRDAQHNSQKKEKNNSDVSFLDSDPGQTTLSLFPAYPPEFIEKPGA
jgi:hypothetical protein